MGSTGRGMDGTWRYLSHLVCLSPELIWDETGAPYASPHHPGLSLGLQRLLGLVYGNTKGKMEAREVCGFLSFLAEP